jgi:DNA-binding NtrC family response regulator
MNPAVVLRGRAESSVARKASTNVKQSACRSTVLIATIDPEIRRALAELLDPETVDAIWVSGVKDFKTLAAREGIVACLCGFWLQDGTYREVIRHLRRERIDIPAIIVSAPACPQEYRGFILAMNLEDLDFLSYPYQKSELDGMLEAALATRARAARQDNAQDDVDFRERGAA